MSQTAIDPTLKIIPALKQKFDLAGYLNRIGYSGSHEPSIETLRAVHLHHAQAIPFENLNPFLRIPVVLDTDSLYQKLVLNKRGGYCFEHNLLLSEVLKSIGFNVKGLAARVLWNQPEGVVTARGHMLLLVEIAKEQYIADVGFGGLTLTAPLQLKPGVEQKTPHEYFRLTASNADYILEAKVQGMWKRIYSFGLHENFLPDYEVTSWYLSNHPTSHFVTGLIAAVPFEKGRHTLRNIDFATHYLDGSHERKRFEEVSQLRDVLQNTFGIVLPDVPSIDESFKELIQKLLKK
jgi:N-hydroxyarylamine O-acetyltransferase